MAEILTKQIRHGKMSVKGLSVSYGDTHVLAGIDLEIRSGEFVSVVGISGAGKTTLVNALAGFVPTVGDIQIAGKIGVVFQDYSVFPWMTVQQNIAFGAKNYSKSDKDEVVRHHLKLIDLENYRDKYPSELSGGQVQRIAIARTLAADPDVVLMDEPYGALDRYTREKMQGWLLDVWSERQTTVIFITHDIEEAMFLADRVLVLGSKHILKEYAIRFERPRTEEIKFSNEFVALRKEIVHSMRYEL